MATKEASRLAKTTEGLDLPFEPLTEQFQLDEEEQRWAERELSHFQGDVLKDRMFKEERHEVAFEEMNIAQGLYKAAEAKFHHEEDFDGALSSWLKWVALHIGGVLYISKSEWLFLAKIYVGLKNSTNSTRALAWAETAAAAEQPIRSLDKKGREILAVSWAREVA